MKLFFVLFSLKGTKASRKDPLTKRGTKCYNQIIIYQERPGTEIMVTKQNRKQRRISEECGLDSQSYTELVSTGNFAKRRNKRKSLLQLMSHLIGLIDEHR